jgi:hypothetical protein
MSPRNLERSHAFLQACMSTLMLSTWAVVSATTLVCCVPLVLVSMLPDGDD